VAAHHARITGRLAAVVTARAVAHRAQGPGVIDEPAQARRVLRTALRAARDDRRLTQEQVVADLEWSKSKLLRIEAGSIGLSVTDLRALLALYGIRNEDTARRLEGAARASRGAPWWHDLRDLVHPQEARRLEYETTATSVLEYAQILVPAPLQTPAYAAAVLTAEACGSADELQVGRRVDLRERWAGFRLCREGVTQSVLLDELTLLRPIGGPAVMRDQVLALLDLARREDVHLAVLPLECGAHDCLEGSFALLEDDGERAVFLDGPMGGALVRDDGDLVAEFARRFERMCAAAWTGERAGRRLAAAADAFAVAVPAAVVTV
jgi:transcriptional regulator with XRE-family HTH domain